MTHATKVIYMLLLTDFVKVSKTSVDDMLYDEQDIARTMKKIEVKMARYFSSFICFYFGNSLTR